MPYSAVFARRAMFVTWMLAATFWAASGERESARHPGESPWRWRAAPRSVGLPGRAGRYSAIFSLTPPPITTKIELPERRASMLRIPSVSWAHLALVAFVAATPATAFAQLTKAGVVTTLLGTATVSRASLSQPRSEERRGGKGCVWVGGSER